VAFRSRRASRPLRRPARLGARLVLMLGLVWGLVGCGFNVQTAQPYTPADGVNADIGSVNVRNLMILSRQNGSGFVSASLEAEEQDTLTAVSGVALKPDGSPGQPLRVTTAGPVTLPAFELVVLTNLPGIIVASPDLIVGLEARLELTFSKAGKLTIVVPVVDATLPGYETVTPKPAATPSV
jgi:hypothetical protein